MQRSNHSLVKQMNAPTTLGVLLVFLFAGQLASLKASDTVRVCSYNVLNYSASNDDGRMPMYTAIFQQIKPDVLLCSEVADNTLGAQFVSQVLTWSSFAFTPYHDGPDSDNQLFYDQTKFNYLQSRVIPTQLRDVLEVQLERVPDTGQKPDTVVFYIAHLKASDDSTSVQRRGAEVAALQASITTQTYAIVAGDLNIYSTAEPAYRGLVFPSSGRPFIDPLGSTWTRNIASQASIYTQCTRADNIKGCGGGVTGGIDDRFDFILLTPQLATRIVPASYTAFGNDGVPRLNNSINDPPNTLVSTQIADALFCASDHLPVYVDLVLGDVKANVEDEQGALPVARFSGDYLVISNCLLGVPVIVSDLQGRTVYSTTPNAPGLVVSLHQLSAGTYIVQHGSHAFTLHK